jgi:hypothetical protein
MSSSKSTKKTTKKKTEEVHISPETVVAAVSAQPVAASHQRPVKAASAEATASKPRAASAPRHRTVKRVAVPVPALAMAAAAGTDSSTPSKPLSPPVTSERIAELAYSYWVSRGCQGGSPHEDWLRAEEELMSSLVISRS